MDILLGLALSQHLGFQQDYNAIHPHLGIRYNSFIAGAYYNSEEKISPYAGYRFEHNGVGLELGAVGGYEKLGGTIPYVRFTYDINDNVMLFTSPSGERIDGEINYGIVAGVELLAF
jgi:hypothetical protein